MIKSMTGYGIAVTETETLTITAEVKSLNSKYMDLMLRLPRGFQEKELEVRNMLTQLLERGKINFSVELQRKGDIRPKMLINRELVKAYYKDLEATAAYIGITPENIFEKALQMPEVMTSDMEIGNNEGDWLLIADTIKEAVRRCELFRNDEGKVLEEKLSEYITKIGRLLDEVESNDPQRIASTRERLRERIREFSAEGQFDENRFEQELIYYIEKLDINEEKVRLRAHLQYFMETMRAKDANGKKLGFIAQEIGREINTIGSKANDAGIQRFVIDMKEELEKIKEQSLNIL
jgi:uncharacterized protein (TIGR00255 family)